LSELPANAADVLLRILKLWPILENKTNVVPGDNVVQLIEAQFAHLVSFFQKS
jgi:hypothetical protein